MSEISQQITELPDTPKAKTNESDGASEKEKSLSQQQAEEITAVCDSFLETNNSSGLRKLLATSELIMDTQRLEQLLAATGLKEKNVKDILGRLSLESARDKKSRANRLVANLQRVNYTLDAFKEDAPILVPIEVNNNFPNLESVNVLKQVTAYIKAAANGELPTKDAQ